MHCAGGCAGSAPRARGTRHLVLAVDAPDRVSRPGPGNTPYSLHRVTLAEVQPRGRGEHCVQPGAQRIRGGSAPRARGTQEIEALKPNPTRFSPAGAGNTIGVWSPDALQPVQPRGRGEHTLGTPIVNSQHGSAPRARGTLPACRCGCEPERFSPAGAGNTTSSLRSTKSCSVQPRGRGEHEVMDQESGLPHGSAPRARGTLCNASPRHQRQRFSPAGAGNTPAAHRLDTLRPVQPRGRGEHHSLDIPEGDVNRFSPAGAGNTQPGQSC